MKTLVDYKSLSKFDLICYRNELIDNIRSYERQIYEGLGISRQADANYRSNLQILSEISKYMYDEECRTNLLVCEYS